MWMMLTNMKLVMLAEMTRMVMRMKKAVCYSVSIFYSPFLGAKIHWPLIATS